MITPRRADRRSPYVRTPNDPHGLTGPLDVGDRALRIFRPPEVVRAAHLYICNRHNTLRSTVLRLYRMTNSQPRLSRPTVVGAPCTLVRPASGRCNSAEPGWFTLLHRDVAFDASWSQFPPLVGPRHLGLSLRLARVQ